MVGKIRKKNKPKFNVQNLGFCKMVKARWRKPRGVGNKKRRKEDWAGASPRVGYRNAVGVRGLHPLGLPEMLVATPSVLNGVKGYVIRIASGVGARKALDIEKAARSAGLMVLNPRKVKPKEAKSEAKKETRKPESKEEKKAVLPEPKASKPMKAGPEPVAPRPPAPEMKSAAKPETKEPKGGRV
jgi:large subunit ribosomal protein L32e